jgi:hypothetical protein
MHGFQVARRLVYGWLLCGMTFASCSSADGPLAIRMYNPQTNQTLHCTARSEHGTHTPVLANAVEACAKQLEASGFVRD